MTTDFDITIIGAGVVGAAVARDLARHQAKVCLIEANAEFGDEASKGNSALMCSGWDTSKGTLERQLVVRGYERYVEEAPKMGLPIKKIGAIMIAWTEAEIERLTHEYQGANAESFPVQWLDKEALYQRLPNIGPGAIAGLSIPGEYIVDPFNTVTAYMEDAVTNGVQYRHSSPLTQATKHGDHWELIAGGRKITSSLVINCAGLGSAKVDNLGGYDDFIIKPRKGQFLVFDKLANPLLDVIALPTPTPTTRGILLTPTVFGNILVGPTADEVEDPNDRDVDAQTIEKLVAAARKVLPDLLDYDVVTNFAGMRPASDKSEYQLIPRLDDNWITVGGIRSTGLSSALGIAEYLSSMIEHRFPLRENHSGVAIQVADFSYGSPRPWESKSATEDDNEIVCHCERITLGEIKAVLDSAVPPTTMKGIKRRTRCGYGRCQSFFCGARVQELLEQNNQGNNDDK